MGHYRLPVHDHPLGERVRDKANHYVTGRDGGRDIDLRRRALEGMRLYGRLTDVRDGAAWFAPDLAANLDRADAVAESIKDGIDAWIAARGLDAPAEPRYVPPWRPAEEPRALDLASIAAVILCTGFRSDYRWVDLPIFDGRGYPRHERGVTAVPGVFVLGLPWLYTWGSGRFSGIAGDAEHLCARIANECRAAAAV
jgi:putative flavoprotein involved in K+ transport